MKRFVASLCRLLQDGGLEEDKDVAEITHLMSRAGTWPEGLRFIARRVKPSRRHKKNMTAAGMETDMKPENHSKHKQ